MRALRSILAAAMLLGLAAAPAYAQNEQPKVPEQRWSFDGIFGSYDLASAQRGLQVYGEVCSTCHSLRYLHYRDLSGIGLSADQIKGFAAGFEVPLGTNDQGEPVVGPALPASPFRMPFANEKAARATNNGALPPDLTLIVNAREGHDDYVYALLNGYTDPPAGMDMQAGMNYNKYFLGHQIAMPQPLHDGQVTYADGTNASIEQMARDVVTFLHWAANPEMVERKQIGWRMVLFFMLLTGLTYAVKRQVWADVH